MINQRYRLISPKIIRVDFTEDAIGEQDVVVRPQYLSICAADQRYYQGLREKAVLDKKLPMCLIHEAVGEIVYDPKGEYPTGTLVAMVPNIACDNDETIKENYRLTSKFSSSSEDGFMRSLVTIDRSRIVECGNLKGRCASLLEPMSVAMNAYDVCFRKYNRQPKSIGVWGDGSIGFVVALVMKKMIPGCEVSVIGTNPEKLEYFSFCDHQYMIDTVPCMSQFDACFECVGGPASSKAINQMIDCIKPQGILSLMGVSEHPVEVNTRMVLEKGLTLVGHSRSSVQDFKDCVELMQSKPEISNYLESIISDEVVIRSITDMYEAFDKDRSNRFKTVMKWEM